MKITVMSIFCSAPLHGCMWECWLQTWSIWCPMQSWFQRSDFKAHGNLLSPPPAWQKPENSPHDSCIWGQSTCIEGVAQLFWWLQCLYHYGSFYYQTVMGCYSASACYTEEPSNSVFWSSSYYCRAQFFSPCFFKQNGYYNRFGFFCFFIETLYCCSQ